MNPIPRRFPTWITGAFVILGGIATLNVASTLTLKTLHFVSENKRKKTALPCKSCRGKGFYICKLCSGNSTIAWSPMYDPVAINPCVCPTCDGNRKLNFNPSTSSADSTDKAAVQDVLTDKPTLEIVDNYREPVEVPPFLNVKKNSWEIIINESHMQPNHKLRLPQHLTYEGVLSSDKNIMLTQLDRDQDAVDSFGCVVVAEEENPHKRYISSGWHAFVKASQLEVGDRLLFSIENYDKNIYVRFVYESDIDSEYDNWSD